MIRVLFSPALFHVIDNVKVPDATVLLGPRDLAYGVDKVPHVELKLALSAAPARACQPRRVNRLPEAAAHPSQHG
eukprot:CAMPEP_0181349694 /NCGR_PEP_ID=MMETSP1106-20121128/863_1 /TAXON_ID=81844 /ORGANISM="Mantoniella antarctica, Strain SL-175" /LENGTH=74 /DNA_ID=CAMNT_0023462105 /DNA_START=1254 /DNA_END=1474 /DNA_ORIENTATION=-